jgi:CRP/FNR family transcriptional regulator
MEKLRKHIEEIIPISDEEFESIKQFFTIRKVLKNQYLIQQGDDAKYEYIIMSGIFRVFYLDEEGKEHIVQFATENWWTSDYIAYFNQKQANMYVVCMEPGEVFGGRDTSGIGMGGISYTINEMTRKKMTVIKSKFL